ncbi:MAG TPA: Asp-tRNA(Asn)/Glu-tRNA(Gln) amidotransferase subunit GatC [Anaerolineae bacterium]|nr:Asp-tRNA(Asn)/Glu-tRNA(Gln) amidotransferase subunit GatC [Anaerolineae bacterium]HOR01143.1 Asp-tRNA(Asn)/Glu-tRNA(Gln) amidotransferase subunit GatC [Anaerolineae bacterium]HPL27274.1 Asp-tRNA(Asn)/Glu-tRNA(Gln) amidotransferase subunit GatC [Anaerolineae bacterium]
MPLTREQVEHIAELAKIALSEGEVELYREQLSAILDHVAALQRLDTEAIAPTARVLEASNVMRPDVAQASLPVEDVLANAPSRRDDAFCVPPVLEEPYEL